MIKLRNLSVFLLVFALAACAQLGLQSPDTFNKKMVAAYATVQTLAETANTAYQADKLSDTDASNVMKTVNASMAALKTAAVLHDTDPAGADTKLAATLAILTALQAYIIAHQGSPS